MAPIGNRYGLDAGTFAGVTEEAEISVGDRVCFAVESGADEGISVTLIDFAASGCVAILGEKRIDRYQFDT